MGVPFEALIPYVIMTAMFGVTVRSLILSYSEGTSVLSITRALG
jgi:hypothetical protein